MRPLLIIEGVTGAGKSSVISALGEAGSRSGHDRAPEIVPEERTLGSIMSDVREPSWIAAPHSHTLDRILDEIETGEGSERPLILERFHLTHFALFPRWEVFDAVDRRLSQSGAVQVLLSYPPELTESRSLDRVERAEEGWLDGMLRWYGSREAAAEAIRLSQRQRWDALALSRLPFLHVDTRCMDWERYAATIMLWWLGEGHAPSTSAALRRDAPPGCHS